MEKRLNAVAASSASAASLTILLLLLCPEGWWPGAGIGAWFTELSRRPLACPAVDCADPWAEGYQLAAENTHLPTSTPATSLHHFPVLIKKGYGTDTAVNTVLSERGPIPFVCLWIHDVNLFGLKD